MKTCPECLRDLYHWHCACGYRAPRPKLAAVPAPDGCPECKRALLGGRCACGYKKPEVAATPLELPKLSDAQRAEGSRRLAEMKQRLSGNWHLPEKEAHK